MRPNPSADSFSGYVRDLALLSDYVYTIMLKELENLFRTAREERFFTVVFPIMRFALRPLAILLMQTPLASAGNPSLGPNAGPPFRFRAVSSKRALAAAVELSSRATRLGPDYANTKSVLDEVTGILRVAFPKVSSRKIETQLEAS
jgi:hypothetical protein